MKTYLDFHSNFLETLFFMLYLPPNKPIQAILFDLDGLLLDTERIYYYAWKKAAEEQNFLLTENLNLELIGRPTQDGEQILARTFGKAFNLPQFQIRWPQIWDQFIDQKGTPVKPGVVEFLQFLHDKPIHKAIATSSLQREAFRSIDPHPFLKAIKTIVTRDQVPQGKPAPDLFLRAAQQLQVDPSACLVFEDSEAGAEAAISAQMNFILIPDLKQPSLALQQQALYCFPSFYPVLQLFQKNNGALG